MVDTLNLPLQSANEYLWQHDPIASDVQSQIDTALIEIKQSALDGGVSKTVTVNIVPDGATITGQSAVLDWSQDQCQEYLYGPDSTTGQVQLNNRLDTMARSAGSQYEITSVVIRVAAT